MYSDCKTFLFLFEAHCMYNIYIYLYIYYSILYLYKLYIIYVIKLSPLPDYPHWGIGCQHWGHDGSQDEEDLAGMRVGALRMMQHGVPRRWMLYDAVVLPDNPR
jgi:hypothetical protein